MVEAIGFCLTPFHLVQVLAFLDRRRRFRVLVPHATRYSELLRHRGDIEFISIEDRNRTFAAIKEGKEAFDFYYAVPWNRMALRFEKLALHRGGKVCMLEDGIGNYGEFLVKRGLRYWVARFAYWLLDGTRYCEDMKEKAEVSPTIEFYSVCAERSALAPRVRQIDFSALRMLLDSLRIHFKSLEPYRGLPVFFDTNDCEGGWYPFEQKVQILREVLPKEPILYLPHPYQRFHLPTYLPNLIDLTGKTHHWNELACYVLRPPRVYTVFSTAVISLRFVYGLEFESILLDRDFYNRTGNLLFNVPPEARSLLE